MKSKEVDCTIYEPNYTKTMERVTRYEPKVEMVPCTYTVMEQHVTPVHKTITVCHPEYQTIQVPVCRTVRVPVCDPCSCCVRYCLVQVTEMCPRTICHMVPAQQDVVVNQVTCVPKQVEGTRPQCTMVPVVHNVEVVHCNMVAKPSKQTVHYCELEAYQTVVRIPVCVPCCNPCACCY
jgi:hypothetical protein